MGLGGEGSEKGSEKIEFARVWRERGACRCRPRQRRLNFTLHIDHALRFFASLSILALLPTELKNLVFSNAIHLLSFLGIQRSGEVP